MEVAVTRRYAAAAGDADGLQQQDELWAVAVLAGGQDPPRFVGVNQAFKAVPSRSRRWSSHDGHSEAMTEYMAESRSSPSSSGAHDCPKLRSTPSKRAPRPSIARRDRSFLASV